mmetsp:Transcript_21046/g.42976  ORF Transcript_21046/g.42976 Transcript_21046/m.42976 type:complete len:202 (-) Transcript_21046:884-1489(-)
MQSPHIVLTKLKGENISIRHDVVVVITLGDYSTHEASSVQGLLNNKSQSNLRPRHACPMLVGNLRYQIAIDERILGIELARTAERGERHEGNTILRALVHDTVNVTRTDMILHLIDGGVHRRNVHNIINMTRTVMTNPNRTRKSTVVDVLERHPFLLPLLPRASFGRYVPIGWEVSHDVIDVGQVELVQILLVSYQSFRCR